MDGEAAGPGDTATGSGELPRASISLPMAAIFLLRIPLRWPSRIKGPAHEPAVTLAPIQQTGVLKKQILCRLRSAMLLRITGRGHTQNAAAPEASNRTDMPGSSTSR